MKRTYTAFDIGAAVDAPSKHALHIQIRRICFRRGITRRYERNPGVQGRRLVFTAEEYAVIISEWKSRRRRPEAALKPARAPRAPKRIAPRAAKRKAPPRPARFWRVSVLDGRLGLYAVRAVCLRRSEACGIAAELSALGLPARALPHVGRRAR